MLIVFHDDNSIIHQLRKLINCTCTEVYILNLRDYLAYLIIFIRRSFYIKNKGFFFLSSIVYLQENILEETIYYVASLNGTNSRFALKIYVAKY